MPQQQRKGRAGQVALGACGLAGQDRARVYACDRQGRARERAGLQISGRRGSDRSQLAAPPLPGPTCTANAVSHSWLPL